MRVDFVAESNSRLRESGGNDRTLTIFVSAIPAPQQLALTDTIELVDFMVAGGGHPMGDLMVGLADDVAWIAKCVSGVDMTCATWTTWNGDMDGDMDTHL